MKRNKKNNCTVHFNILFVVKMTPINTIYDICLAALC